MTDVQTQQLGAPEETTSSTTPTPQVTTTPEVPAAPVALTAEAFTLPQGFTLEAGSMEKFLGVLNDSAMTPQQRGQALIELQAGLATQSEEARSQAWSEQRQNWHQEIAADPEIGGNKFPETIAAIGGLMDKFGSPEIRQAFDQTGAGDNPAIVKFLFNLSQALTEGKPAAPGNPAGGTGRTIQERIYGTSQ